MDLIQLALFTLAKKEEITATQFRILSALRKKSQDFIELSDSTGAEMMELKEILSEFEKKKLVKQRNGKYSIDALKVLDSLITKNETVRQLAE